MFMERLLGPMFLFEAADTASGAGGAESGQEAAQTGQESGDQGAAQLAQAFEQFQQQFGQRFEQLEARLPEPAQEEAEPAAPDFENLESLPEEFVDPESGGLTMEGLEALIDQRAEGMAQRLAQEAVNPILAREENNRRIAEADALEAEFPDLGDEEVQNTVFDRAGMRAQELARMMGRPELAQLAQEPKFLRETYLAMVAEQRSGLAESGGAAEVQLERGGSARPSGAQQGMDRGDRIVALAKKQHHRVGR